MVGLFVRGVAAGAALLLAEVAYAVLRPTPLFPEFDPSTELGNSDHPDLRIAVLGDSTITAPGLAGPHESWIRLISERIASSGHRVILQSFAVGGSMAHDLVRDQLQPALAFDPDMIFVSVGGNDLLKGVSKKDFEESLDELIAGLTSSDAIIIQSGLGDLGTIPRLVPPLRNLISRRSDDFDEIHKGVAARHGSHVVEQRSDSRDIWYTDRSLWSADLFHVSAKGHERWANTGWKTVEPLVPQPSINPERHTP